MKIRTNIEINDRDFYKAMFNTSLKQGIELRYEDAIEYIQAIGGYNDFEAYKVIQMLHDIDLLIPRMKYGPNNPNNGRRNYKIVCGRESSPVIYLKMYEIGWEGYEKIKEVELLEGKIQSIAYQIGKADEFSLETNYSNEPVRNAQIEIRIWWD